MANLRTLRQLHWIQVEVTPMQVAVRLKTAQSSVLLKRERGKEKERERESKLKINMHLSSFIHTPIFCNYLESTLFQFRTSCK